MSRGLVLWSLLALLSSPSIARAERLLAILPLDVSHAGGKLNADARADLEEMLRDVATDALTGAGWTVLTGETTLQVLKDNGIVAERCGDQSCHLAMAREIKAEKFLSGNVRFVERLYTASIRLIDTATGRILASQSVEGDSVTALRHAFKSEAAAFFAKGGLQPQAPVTASAVAENGSSKSSESSLADMEAIRRALTEEVTPAGPTRSREDERVSVKRALGARLDTATRTQLLFRYAQLTWQQAQYVEEHDERAAFREAEQKWRACQTAGNLTCGDAPALDSQNSDALRHDAIENLRGLVQDYPNDTRAQEVQFVLARSLLEQAQRGRTVTDHEQNVREALAAFKDLVALHPESPWSTEALVQLCTWYFDRRELARADASCQAAVGKHDPKSEVPATLSLAWVRYSLGRNGELNEPRNGDCGSVCLFKRAVELAARSEAPDAGRWRSEALNGLVKAYAREGKRDAAISYFKTIASADATALIVSLGNEFFTAGGGQWTDAIKTFQWLLQDSPLNKEARLRETGERWAGADRDPGPLGALWARHALVRSSAPQRLCAGAAGTEDVRRSIAPRWDRGTYLSGSVEGTGASFLRFMNKRARR